MTADQRKVRFNGLLIVAGLVFAALVLRLTYLQLAEGKQYQQIADQNRIRTITAEAPRGNIYDRRGALLVSNRPSFAVTVIPFHFIQPESAVPLLSKILAISETEINTMLEKAKDYPFTPVRLKRNVNDITIAAIEERRDELPGVVIEAIPVREYIYKQLAAHICGYIGLISAEEWEQLQNKGYSQTDLIGKTGIEQVWEAVLRGVDGGQQVEVDAAGRVSRLLGDRSAVPGRGLILTIDANVQKAAEDALEEGFQVGQNPKTPVRGAGAVVAIDPRSGEIIAMTSRPAFDPNAFAAGISQQDWNKLISDPLNPFSNRVFQNAYPPGSVFKVVTSAAALDLKVTTPDEVFTDRGVYVLGGWKFYGWKTDGLGPLKLPDALAWSSDPFFYEMGSRIGIDRLAAYARTFGYGQATGIEFPGEEAGLVPTAEWKQQQYDEPWYAGETIIAAIGQGYLLATPLQQAMSLMAVANGGTLYRPYVVSRVLANDGTVMMQKKPQVYQKVNLAPEHWAAIRQGLRQVVAAGTASGIFTGLPVTVAGKTGTAETQGENHAWFACYAPADNPELVVVAFVENGGEGSTNAAPIARKVLESYFLRH